METRRKSSKSTRAASPKQANIGQSASVQGAPSLLDTASLPTPPGNTVTPAPKSSSGHHHRHHHHKHRRTSKSKESAAAGSTSGTEDSDNSQSNAVVFHKDELSGSEAASETPSVKKSVAAIRSSTSLARKPSSAPSKGSNSQRKSVGAPTAAGHQGSASPATTDSGTDTTESSENEMLLGKPGSTLEQGPLPPTNKAKLVHHDPVQVELERREVLAFYNPLKRALPKRTGICCGCSPWVVFSWLVTLWMPSPVLRWMGKDSGMQQAWREKMALCFLVLLCCGVMAFLTYGVNLLLCKGGRVPQTSPVGLWSG